MRSKLNPPAAAARNSYVFPQAPARKIAPLTTTVKQMKDRYVVILENLAKPASWLITVLISAAMMALAKSKRAKDAVVQQHMLQKKSALKRRNVLSLVHPTSIVLDTMMIITGMNSFAALS